MGHSASNSFPLIPRIWLLETEGESSHIFPRLRSQRKTNWNVRWHVLPAVFFADPNEHLAMPSGALSRTLLLLMVKAVFLGPLCARSGTAGTVGVHGRRGLMMPLLAVDIEKNVDSMVAGVDNAESIRSLSGDSYGPSWCGADSLGKSDSQKQQRRCLHRHPRPP